MEKLPATGLSILTFVTVRNHKKKKNCLRYYLLAIHYKEDGSNLKTFVFVVETTSNFPNPNKKKEKHFDFSPNRSFGCIGGQQKRNKKKSSPARKTKT